MPNSLLEFIAAMLGVVSVWLIVRRNIWGFPIGIIMVCLYAVVFYSARFYSDMALQIIYVVLQIHGWYEWSRSDEGQEQKITVKRLGTRRWLNTVALQIFGSVLMGYCMWRFTNASLPWLDAVTTTMSLLAQWWMNKKYLECWLLWIIVNIIYLFQYSIKGLYFTTALYSIFLVLAIIGLRTWRQQATFV